MNFNYKVEYYNYNKRNRNLEVEAQGKIKSQKFFPVFLKDGKEEIFKPLSKTKPYSTPFFAYSELFWSNIIQEYFDKKAPVYRLAICSHYDEYVPKYHNEGTIVPSIINKDEKLVNLFEHFRDNPDSEVDINEYKNYCMKIYDYTNIFDSKLIKENRNLGENLAKQILFSVLRADQNFHYENVNFISKDKELTSLAPPIDHEFSTMFMFLDDLEEHKKTFNEFIIRLTDTEVLDEIDKLLIHMVEESGLTSKFYPLRENLNIIVKRYENVTLDFLERLELFINDLKKNPINLKDNNFIKPFNSNDFEAGIALYKENNPIKAKEQSEKNTPKKDIDLDMISKLIQEEVLEVAMTLKNELTKRLDKNKVKVK